MRPSPSTIGPALRDGREGLMNCGRGFIPARNGPRAAVSLIAINARPA